MVGGDQSVLTMLEILFLIRSHVAMFHGITLSVGDQISRPFLMGMNRFFAVDIMDLIPFS